MNQNKTKIHEQVDKFLDGDLSEKEIDRLWAKLIQNPDALDYLETKATLRKMSIEGRYETEKQTNNGSIKSINESGKNRVAAYASYLIAASVLIVGITFSYNTLSDSDFDIEAIAVIEYETERSSESMTSEFESMLNTAISLSADGYSDQAIMALHDAYDANLSDSQKQELLMLEGTIYYNAGNFNEALSSFKELTESDNIDILEYEKAVWYKANSYIQLGDYDLAKQHLTTVVQLDGAFSRVAGNILDKMNG